MNDWETALREEQEQTIQLAAKHGRSVVASDSPRSYLDGLIGKQAERIAQLEAALQSARSYLPEADKMLGETRRNILRLEAENLRLREINVSPGIRLGEVFEWKRELAETRARLTSALRIVKLARSAIFAYGSFASPPFKEMKMLCKAINEFGALDAAREGR